MGSPSSCTASSPGGVRCSPHAASPAGLGGAEAALDKSLLWHWCSGRCTHSTQSRQYRQTLTSHHQGLSIQPRSMGASQGCSLGWWLAGTCWLPWVPAPMGLGRFSLESGRSWGLSCLCVDVAHQSAHTALPEKGNLCVLAESPLAQWCAAEAGLPVQAAKRSKVCYPGLPHFPHCVVLLKHFIYLKRTKHCLHSFT